MKEPPSRSPFSSRVTRAPSSMTRRAATSPARPPPATRTCNAASGQGEGRLVFHVLNAHALRAADKDRDRVGTIDPVLYLEAVLLGLSAVILRGVHQATEMVEPALRPHASCRGDEPQPVLPGLHRRGVLPRREAHPDETARGLLRSAGAQDEAFEVVVHEVSLPLNQRERKVLRTAEEVTAIPRLDVRFCGKAGDGCLRVCNADVYALYWSLGDLDIFRGVEEGQLADPAPCADEGVTVGAVDYVKVQVRGQEFRCRIPVAHVERYVIQLKYVHLPSLLQERSTRVEDTTHQNPFCPFGTFLTSVCDSDKIHRTI